MCNMSHPSNIYNLSCFSEVLTSTSSDPKGVITSPGWVLGWYPAHAASTDYVYTVTSGDNGLSLFIADLDVGGQGASCTNADFILKVSFL